MFEKMYSAVNGVWNLSSEQVISYQKNIFFFSKCILIIIIIQFLYKIYLLPGKFGNIHDNKYSISMVC